MSTERHRLAVSTEGQVRFSIRHPRTSHAAQINADAEFWSLANEVYVFLRLVERLYGTVQRSASGLVSFELREIRGWQIHFERPDLLRKNDGTNSGVADQDQVLSGDVVWSVGKDTARVAADSMGELAIQFKWENGDRVRFDHAELARHFDAAPNSLGGSLP